MLNEYITPQLYGAKGDGTTDDTEAFQKAVDSGYDVFVPTAKRETYLITRPIKITKKQCKRIFSEPLPRRTDSGAIIVNFEGQQEPRASYLFDVHTQLLTIGGLRFVCRTVDGHRAGIFINAMDSVCDYDIQIENCSITNFYQVFMFKGRGLEIINSKITSSQYLADLYWDDEEDSNKNHPAAYDQRAISIKNCRLHNIASAFLRVRSGHAYGLHFQGNTVDNGRGYLIRAYDQAYGWNISGNTIQGINGNFDVMEFRKGMKDCIITGNTFLSDKGYWAGTENTVNSWIKCGGNVTSCIINNNIFKNADNGFMTFNNLDGSTIVGNAIHNTTASTASAINITGKSKKSAIIGNAIVSTNPTSLLAKTLPKDNTVL